MKIKIGTFTWEECRKKKEKEVADAFEKAHPKFKYFGGKCKGSKLILYACDNFDEAMDI